ncbi:MAG: hypothetical protein WCS31_10985 [Verrucomicrobiae bacterium]
MIEHLPTARVWAWAVVCFFVASSGLWAASEWQVPESSIRYKLELAGKPTHPSAGYFVHLPDGGILPGSTVTTVVMTEEGKVIPGWLLWQNADTGFSMVFADPGSPVRAVYVYVLSGRVAQLWKPESGLTPSAILCASPGHDSLPAAQALAKLGRVEPSVHSTNHAGISKAPFSIGGDLTGRPRPGSFYFLTYLEADKAGSYWFAPMIIDGQCEIFLDGTKLNPKEHSKKWGGTGASVELTKGLHRVEVFQTAGGTGNYSDNKKSGGLMFLTWRPPDEDPDRNKGTESRVINRSEIVRSGDCKLTAVESRNGAPVAVATATPGLCYWFENEDPLIVYDLSALTAGQPDDATYTWTFPKEGEFAGADVQWLFPGLRENSAKLTVKSGKGTSTCVVPFFGFSTQMTNLEEADQREAFRNVLTTMLKAYPRSPDPVANWSSTWWNNILRTVEGREGYTLLLQLFTSHLDAARKKLSPGQLFALQDVLLDQTQRQNPGEALQWIQKFQPDASSVSRRSELKLREGEIQMYDFDDRKKAEKTFAELGGPGESSERAKVRLGDLAFLEGDLNKATAFYADVQRRARARRNAAPSLAGSLVADQLVQGGPAQPAQPDWRSSQPASQNPLKTGGGPEQKHGALQEVSLSENVRTLIADNFLLEARQALLAWEIEFPLSKISGDYILRESAFHMKMGDWKRARPMLEAYCRQIDASGFLPAAASMLIACVDGAKETPSPALIETLGKVKDRLKYHPVAADLDRFLSDTGKPSN